MPRSELPVTAIFEKVDVPVPVIFREGVSMGPAKVEVEVFVTIIFVIVDDPAVTVPRFVLPETVRLLVEALFMFT